MLRIAITALLALTTPAMAQMTAALGPAAPALKRSVTVASDVVRIGDFIDNAGAAAQIPIFRAPDPGATGSVPVERVLEAARAHNVLGIEANGISEVTVTRASRVITAHDIEKRIARIIADQRGLDGPADLVVRLDRPAPTMHVEPTAIAPLRAVRLSDDPRMGNFDIVLELPGSAAARGFPLHFTGTALEMVQAATLAHSLKRGEIMGPSDIVMERRPKADVGRGFLDDPKLAVGLAPRRTMSAGQMLRQADLMKPELVRRNDMVTLVYEMPGIVLTSRGKALETGSDGDIISVVNIQSRRTVQGTVTASGTVTVSSVTPQIVASAISLYSAGHRLSQLTPTE
jgi:flagellar basal body P-ring formation protein FlgA